MSLEADSVCRHHQAIAHPVRERADLRDNADDCRSAPRARTLYARAWQALTTPPLDIVSTAALLDIASGAVPLQITSPATTAAAPTAQAAPLADASPVPQA